MKSSIPKEYESQSLYPGDLRSGQFRGLPIISTWGNMKMLPVSHKPIETTQLFQDHVPSNHPICADPGATDDQGSPEGHLRSNDVTIRFSPISRDSMEIETRK